MLSDDSEAPPPMPGAMPVVQPAPRTLWQATTDLLTTQVFGIPMWGILASGAFMLIYYAKNERLPILTERHIARAGNWLGGKMRGRRR